MADDHKAIAHLREYAGRQTDEEIKQRWVHMDDTARVRDLQNIATWFDDPSSNLRAKSQILRLHRELGQLHQTLRAIGK
jgi:inorganic triphosphatase YgiF